MIPKEDWRWFGSAGHLCVGNDCRFHLCTQVGGHLVSTVGEYLPDEGVREILASSRGVALEGRGDARRADFLNKVGHVEVGCDRKYETMVFQLTKGECGCGCGLPSVDFSELDIAGYNDAKAATEGHTEMCLKWAKADPE